MAYVKQNWENLPNRTTPISAQRLNHLETQYEQSVSSFSDPSVMDPVVAGVFQIPEGEAVSGLNDLFHSDGIPSYFAKAGINNKVESRALDYGIVRTADTTNVEIARLNTNNRWMNSEVRLHKIGNIVHINGVLRRNQTNGDPETLAPLSTSVSPFTMSEAMLPRPPFGSIHLHLACVGINRSITPDASKLTIPVTLQINPNGATVVFNGDPDRGVEEIIISGSYEAKQEVLIDPLDYPEFDGTYFKSFMRNQGMVEGVNYSVINRRGQNPKLASIAIHAGSGEYGSESCALEMSKELEAHLYLIDGYNGDYSNLHMSSNGFDDPRATGFVREAERTISWHGFRDELSWSPAGTSYIGGLDRDLGQHLINALNFAGFPAIDATQFSEIAGTSPGNICNQGANGGVQIELDNTLRRSFFEGGDFSRTNRPNKTATFYQYMDVINNAISQFMN